MCINFMPRLVFIGLCLLYLDACGKKGGLYLPADASAVTPTETYSISLPIQKQSAEEQVDGQGG